ncbi:putative helicase [Bodo saltans virus]|uniref:Replication origin-binding protein n=1 Tax=Bodo saltans virus TaxID=2024608 RepID=A0A2H4UVH4_9VIRU|nr:putative helicase [Bodo saltans virus]ATZ80867.1 putative helicase [Bodo saltans virus]
MEIMDFFHNFHIFIYKEMRTYENKKMKLEKTINPYGCKKIGDIVLHYGNGAKNELKKQDKKYNFKFYHRIGKDLKLCSAGFDLFSEFIDFIKPLSNKFYIFEYVFENKKCTPYFDYEYYIDKKLSDEELNEKLSSLIKLIKNKFNEIFNKKITNENIKILSSHGQKNDSYKISFHIIITEFYFDNNEDCKYICNILYDNDNNFDKCVYSHDRMMRTALSYKDFKDNRQMIAINHNHEHIDINLKDIKKYLITNVKDNYEKLSVPIKVKREVIKQTFNNHKDTIKHNINIKQENNEIGYKLEAIIKEKFHDDVYFLKSVTKYDDIIFYSFNYTNRNQSCFTCNKHEQIGFYCYIDNMNNIILKCFSEKCKESKFIIGNINETMTFEQAIEINERYITNEPKVINLMKNNKKTTVIISCMGTGKTEQMIHYIEKYNPTRILWISTRQSYANNISERMKKLNFTNYLDDKIFFHIKDRIIVQLESLHSLEKDMIVPFDLIVLDEIESILNHFSSDTIKHQSKDTFNLLHMLCTSEESKIIMMDADYSIRAHEFTKNIGEYDIIQNNYKNPDIYIDLIDDLNYFMNDIKNAVNNKLNICIITLSTKLLTKFEELFTEMNVKYFIHTRDTDDQLKKGLINVNDLWTAQVTMFSPTITVGVDHTKIYFDKIYSIIVPKCASARVYIQMLGRIRNPKNNRILTYYNNVNTSINKYLYNYNDMKEYFEYINNDVQGKEYKRDENGHIYLANNVDIYKTIMGHNKIEDLNKSSEYFFTVLNMLCNKSNYKLIFSKYDVKNDVEKIELDDKSYKRKIINAREIDDDEYINIYEKINLNNATSDDKFALQKYNFKKFWMLENITENDVQLYFRNEIKMNRLLELLNRNKIGNKYNDISSKHKIKIMLNIINTLGFDINNMDKLLSASDYCKNRETLLSDSDFSKNYKNIRILFDRPKTSLNANMKGQSFAKFMNGFLSEFCLYIQRKSTTLRNNGKKEIIYKYKLNILNEFNNIIAKIENEQKKIHNELIEMFDS